MEEVLKAKDDSTRMFGALKLLKRKSEKKPLLIDTNDGLTTNEEEQVKKIAEFFHSALYSKDAKNIENIKPEKMRNPFTKEEVQKAINSLKNNRSAGIDEIKAEQLKYGSNETIKEITEILNEMAKTGKYPKEIKQGILTPLQKPGKKQGPCANLRPIILLSMLREILAIIIRRRTSSRILTQVPNSQAEYQSGRSTLEQVLAMKILAEKAIISKNYTTHILMMDMSKAFDTIDRATIIEELKEVVEIDELHMIKLLLEDVELIVKIGKRNSEPFKTNIGAPQGDCLSPILFIWYLARTLEERPKAHLADHQYCKKQEDTFIPPPLPPPQLIDHAYPNMKPEAECRTITPQYADDISWIVTSSYNLVDHYKKIIPPKLEKRKLKCNPEKTEEYKITNIKENEWKNCKYLGSKLGTNEDFVNRKRKTIEAMETWTNIWQHKKFKDKQKYKYFLAFVEPIFLYTGCIDKYVTH